MFLPRSTFSANNFATAGHYEILLTSNDIKQKTFILPVGSYKWADLHLVPRHTDVTFFSSKLLIPCNGVWYNKIILLLWNSWRYGLASLQKPLAFPSSFSYQILFNLDFPFINPTPYILFAIATVISFNNIYIFF